MSIEPFEVHPDPMIRESNRLLDGVEQSRRDHDRHHSELEAQAPGMMKLSREALTEAHAALVDQTRILHKNLTEHGMSMQQFTGQVVAMDNLNAGNYGQGR